MSLYYRIEIYRTSRWLWSLLKPTWGGQERLLLVLSNPMLEHTRKLSIGPMIASMQIPARLALSPAPFL